MEKFADLVKIHYQYHKNPRNYRKFIPDDYSELEEYTDDDSIVFKKDNEIVIAMRGLDPKQIRDLKIGAEIIIGDVTNPRGFDFDSSRGKYKEILDNEQDKYEKVKQKYPDAKIIFAGHSRGGRKAIDLGKHNNEDYKAFNPGDATSLRDYLYTTIAPTMLSPPSLIDDIEYFPIAMAGAVASIRAASSPNPYMRATGSSIQSLVPQMAMKSAREVYLKRAYAQKADELQLVRLFIERGFIPPEEYENALRLQEETANPYNVYLEREDFGEIATGVVYSQLPLLPTQKGNNENIFVTERDIVSHGYKGGELAKYFGGRPTIVEPKDYVKSLDPTHHTIDHFTTKELLEKIEKDEKIEVLQDNGMSIPSRFDRELQDNFSPRAIRTSGATKPRPISVSELCDAYPQLIECQYIREKQSV